MKINNKLLIAVFIVITPAILLLFLSLNFLNQKFTNQREFKEYENTGDMIKQFILLQDDKLGLVFDSIKNDALFMHSILLYQDLGYKDRLVDILSESIKKDSFDVFFFIARKGDQVSNAQYQLSEKEISTLCTPNSPAKIIVKPIAAYLKCFPVDYHQNHLGNLIIGHDLYPNFEQLLSTSMSHQVKVITDEPLNMKKGSVDKLGSEIYYNYPLQNFFPEVFGRIEFKKIYDVSQDTRDNALATVFIVVLSAFTFMSAGLYLIFWYLVPRRLKKVRDIIEKTMETKSFKHSHVSKDEIIEIQMALNHLFQKIDAHEQQKRQNEIAIRLAGISQQLAHDIRSPLAALKMATTQINELPEDSRLLIRSAVQRIDDIANDLAGKKSQTVQIEDVTNQDGLSLHLLSSLIDPLVSEKRLQHRSKLSVNIEANLDENSYGLFAKIQPTEFKRVISNLINNAVEGIESEGRVCVELSSNTDKIILKVADTGKGIPPDILPKLMQRGETHGKSNGSGLGLFHAKESIEKWGGAINIESTVGVGTTVTLTLPSQNPPTWFVPQINLQPGMMVAILDDDNSIHQIWRGRFEAFENIIDVHHFSVPDEFIGWFREQKDLKNFLVLCDFEFLGANKNGLDVIRELSPSPLAGRVLRQGEEGRGEADFILVTSRFEEENVRKGCEEFGVQLIPKNLAGFVPIQIATPSPNPLPMGEGEQSTADAVLIDDDKLVHDSWKIAAKKANKKLHTYFQHQDFLKDGKNFSKETLIYIDSNLAAGIKGEDIAWMINKKGFVNLYLATGYNTQDFEPMPWIKKIVGKNPPW